MLVWCILPIVSNVLVYVVRKLLETSHCTWSCYHYIVVVIKKGPALQITFQLLAQILFWASAWRRGVVVITTAQLHSTKPERRFCASSNPARGVSDIRDGEDLWQRSRLEITLIAFCRSTIPQNNSSLSSSSSSSSSSSTFVVPPGFYVYQKRTTSATNHKKILHHR